MLNNNPKFMQLLEEMLINSREIVALLKEYNIAIGNLPPEKEAPPAASPDHPGGEDGT